MNRMINDLAKHKSSVHPKLKGSWIIIYW